jgi:hypothetical protein
MAPTSPGEIIDDDLAGDRRRWSRRAAPYLIIVALAAVAHGAALAWPFMNTDDYVLDNARSDSWGRHFSAFNVDFPSPNTSLGHWAAAGTVPVERRFIRILPSALIWAEARLFGHHALAFHAVTLAIHMASCCVVYALAVRSGYGARPSIIAALVPAVHPIGIGVTNMLNCQPAAVTALFMTLSVWWWMRYRRTNAVRDAIVASTLILAAMTSYEVAVLLPIVVAFGDFIFARKARWSSRLGVLATFPVYFAMAWAVRRGVTHGEAGPPLPLRYAWRSLRIDGASYLLKTLMVFDPRDFTEYWLLNTVGEAGTWLIVVAVVLPLFAWARRRPVAVLGLVSWALLLAPPYLVRSIAPGVSRPSMRQAYLPMFAVPLLVLEALPRHALTLSRRLLVLSLIVSETVQSMLAASLNRLRRDRELVSVLARRALDGTGSSAPLVVLNDRRKCAYNPRFDWPDRDVLRPIPVAKEGLVVLRNVDDHTLEASAPNGFDLPLARERLLPSLVTFGPGSSLIPRVPPPLVVEGRQRIEEATVSVLERDSSGIRRLLVRFDRPLRDHVFVQIPSCGRVELYDPSGPSD